MVFALADNRASRTCTWITRRHFFPASFICASTLSIRRMSFFVCSERGAVESIGNVGEPQGLQEGIADCTKRQFQSFREKTAERRDKMKTNGKHEVIARIAGPGLVLAALLAMVLASSIAGRAQASATSPAAPAAAPAKAAPAAQPRNRRRRLNGSPAEPTKASMFMATG